MSRDVEAPIQAAIVEAVRLIYPAAIVASVPNGGYVLAPRAVAKLKWVGLQPGMPDLLVTWAARDALGPLPACGFLEVKGPKGRLSESQAHIHALLTDQGHNLAVVRSVDEALTALDAWGVPRGRQ